MISVALPVVKTRFFAEALDGVLAQTHADFEVIVVDNAADGDVRAEVARRDDSRLRYVRHDVRLPVIENWNRCLDYAERDYFVLASDDDVYLPGFLADIAALIARHPAAGVYHARARIIDEAGALKRLAPACPEIETALEFIWHRMARMREHYVSDFVYPTRRLRDEGGFVDFPGAWFSDEATAFRHGLRGGVACSPEPTFCYRESAISLTSRSGVPVKLSAIARYEDWLRERLEAVPDSGTTRPVLDGIRAEMPRRLDRMRYRLLLEPGLRGLPAAVKLVLGHGREYRLSLRRLAAAGALAVVARRFDR